MIKRGFMMLVLALVAFTVMAQDITLLFDNDVHCAIDGYAKIAALRRETPKEFTVMISAGDFLNGEAIGTIDKGEKIIDIMNAVKYDIVVPGNHEFDYGIDILGQRLGELDAKSLCMNFHKGEKNMLSASTVREYNGRRIAFIGVTTPALIQESNPSFFMDSTRQFIYDFGGKNFIKMVQEKVDDIRREGVDYIVLIGHIGIETDQFGISTPKLLQQTTGIDIVIDGHSHDEMDEEHAKFHAELEAQQRAEAERRARADEQAVEMLTLSDDTLVSLFRAIENSPALEEFYQLLETASAPKREALASRVMESDTRALSDSTYLRCPSA